MMIHYTFLPGVRQAQQAASYFKDVAGELIDAHVSTMDPRQYLVMDPDVGRLHMRIWTQGAYNTDAILYLVPWLRDLKRDATRFQDGAIDDESVHAFMEELLGMDNGTFTFFLDVLNPMHAFTPKEFNDLSIGVVGGSLVLFSANNLIGVELGTGLFGASLAGYGSIQCETTEARPMMRVA